MFDAGTGNGLQAMIFPAPDKPRRGKGACNRTSRVPVRQGVEEAGRERRSLRGGSPEEQPLRGSESPLRDAGSVRAPAVRLRAR
jgi:hypothetical protein